MLASLNKLKQLPDATHVLCAHEYTVSNLRFAQMVEPGNPDIRARMESSTALRKMAKPTVPSTLGLERQTNPFLRTDVKSVVQAAENYAHRSLQTEVEVFATLRRWKDNV